jgi:hypothetical protein
MHTIPIIIAEAGHNQLANYDASTFNLLFHAAILA